MRSTFGFSEPSESVPVTTNLTYQGQEEEEPTARREMDTRNRVVMGGIGFLIIIGLIWLNWYQIMDWFFS